MSTEDQASGRGALVEALQVRRNLKRGLAVGLGFAVVIFGFFVVLAPETTRSRLYYLGLAFVLAMTTSGLVAALLVARRAYRLAQDL
jgi:hypothetical protein